MKEVKKFVMTNEDIGKLFFTNCERKTYICVVDVSDNKITYDLYLTHNNYKINSNLTKLNEFNQNVKEVVMKNKTEFNITDIGKHFYIKLDKRLIKIKIISFNYYYKNVTFKKLINDTTVTVSNYFLEIYDEDNNIIRINGE